MHDEKTGAHSCQRRGHGRQRRDQGEQDGSAEYGPADRHRDPVAQPVPETSRRRADRYADQVGQVQQRDEVRRQKERRPGEVKRQVVEYGGEGPERRRAHREDPQQVVP